jgi:putative methyltransferase (TIGR04325 family)
MTRLKSLLRLITPPIILMLRQRLVKATPEWEYIPDGWQHQDPAIKGWAQTSVLNAYISRWKDFEASIQGTKPFGASPEAIEQQSTNLSFHNLMMSYAYALTLASIGKSSLTMLDWGGGIGHYHLITRILRSDLSVDYHCADFAIFADYGRSLFPQAHFYGNDDWKNRLYQFVLASGSLHFAEDWRDILRSLAGVTEEHLFVTRVPLVHRVPSYVMVQRPYQYGYDTEYLGWCLNRGEVLDAASQAGLTLVREFVVENAPYIHKAPEQPDYWGFLFRK